MSQRVHTELTQDPSRSIAREFERAVQAISAAWKAPTELLAQVAETPLAKKLRDHLVPHALERSAPLVPAIDAERRTMRTHKGHVLSYYDDRRGSGRPIVLLHSINACASAYEMKPLFDHFRGRRPVYALDLPGFGFSDREALHYTPEGYAEELAEFLARVRDQVDAVDVVALSLTSELVARACASRKDLIHTLTFISPTGLEAKSRGRETSQESASAIFGTAPERLWAPLLFAAIASRPSIRYFLGKAFVGPVDPGLREYAHATSHQPGAWHAPLAFLRGKLFTPAIFETYAQLQRPVLVIYDRDAYTQFDRLEELVQESPLWTSKRIAPSRGMPQFERLEDTTRALEEFWQRHAQKHEHAPPRS